MSTSLLSLERVTKRFNGTTAVDSVSFAVDRGEVVGFLGPNGAGKSTTMRMITQLLEPDAGAITFDGRPLAEAAREARRRLGFLPENNPLYTEMLAAEYLEFVARLRQLPGGTAGRRRAVDDAVAATGIGSVCHRPIGELSKGFRQRVGLAAAILHRPDLLVLDEPTEGLDPNQRVDIRRLIADLGRERTVLLSTHVLPEVQHTCSRVIIINRGRIVADGSVQDLMTRAAQGTRVHVEARGASADVIERRLGALEGVAGIERGEAAEGRVRLTLAVAGEHDIREAVFETARREGWTLLELHRESASLEDLFRLLTATEAGDHRPQEAAA
ncbi:MAG: ATP-binding cassette domain-containing protein [Gemmatimonadaceae bacterium]|nr:ATP-binding cassette domain-containing protein [Gemmatimonadaceae bacterium]